MAARLAQAPLPWLPEGAVEAAPGVGFVLGEDGSGQAWVHGMMTFAWDAGDEVLRRLAAVQLATALRAASMRQVADALGTAASTVSRWAAAYQRDGLDGLVPEGRGPKGPSRLTAELVTRIRQLRADGLPMAKIAAVCEVSEFSVRCALGLVAERQEAIARLAGDIPAGSGGGEQPEEPRDRIGGAAEDEVLPVLPDPVPREAERVLARFGLIGEGAEPVFTPGGRYPLAGLLLALPALDGAGLLQSARAVYGRLKNGFYGLETVLVLLVFLALLREPRAEGATRVPPAALGRVLGLDRAPEVKTIRRKLGELAAAGKAAALQLAVARYHADSRPDELGFLYIDGHTRAYFGTREVQKMHIARMKLPGPATEETWVTGASGDPLLVVMAEPSSSLAAQVKQLLPQLRAICGPCSQPVLCFDRGGWSPDLFACIIDAGFDLLTYRKAGAGKEIPAIEDEKFAAVTLTGDDGRARAYDLADTDVQITVTSGEHKGRVLDLRQVTRRDKGKQVHVLTTRSPGELPAAAVVYRMGNRWREENYFRYARWHFALDALDSYAVTPDGQRMVPNPAKKTAAAQVKAARKALAAAEATRQRTLDKLRSPAPGTTAVITNSDLARLDKPVDAARRKLQAAQDQSKAIPAKIPLTEHNPDMVRLDTETKLLTHAIRMAAYNSEITLARALPGDEACAIIREALTTSGDIIPGDGTLTVRLDPLSAPRRTRAIAALCGKLNAADARYPGTSLALRYEIKPDVA
jgi:transposase